MTTSSPSYQITEMTLADSPEMAQVHDAAFPDGQAWDAQQIADLMRQMSVRARAVYAQGKILSFLLFQTAIDQTEILTLATMPSARRRGLAAAATADPGPGDPDARR